MENPQYRRLTASDLDQVRSNTDWQKLFEGLGLKRCERKSKADDWWTYSPFHEESEPSFHMGPGGVWYDFSIGAGGGVLELVQRLRGINCYEAARYVVDQGWSRIARSSSATQVAEKTKQRSAKAIAQGEHSNPAIRQDLLPLTSYHDYLTERGLGEETCNELGIGFLGQGRSPLRGRVIFQVRDARIKAKERSRKEPVIISHLGRVIDDGKPKYLYYEGFRKSAELLGQDRCWLHQPTIDQIRETGFILVTEGPFDWAKCIDAGLLNVVATMGAQLSAAQATKLQSLCDHHQIGRILLAFDRDETGKDGVKSAATTTLTLGITSQIFDWETQVGLKNGQPVVIDRKLRDLAQMKNVQLQWLRAKKVL